MGVNVGTSFSAFLVGLDETNRHGNKAPIGIEKRLPPTTPFALDYPHCLQRFAMVCNGLQKTPISVNCWQQTIFRLFGNERASAYGTEGFGTSPLNGFNHIDVRALSGLDTTPLLVKDLSDNV